MNGLSDVRLALHRCELNATAAAPAANGVAPASGTSRWELMWRRYVTRRQLLILDAEQLKDIGVTRGDALAEGLKPFWRQ